MSKPHETDLQAAVRWESLHSRNPAPVTTPAPTRHAPLVTAPAAPVAPVRHAQADSEYLASVFVAACIGTP